MNEIKKPKNWILPTLLVVVVSLAVAAAAQTFSPARVRADWCTAQSIDCQEQVCEKRCGGVASGQLCKYNDDCPESVSCSSYCFWQSNYKSCGWVLGECRAGCEPGQKTVGSCITPGNDPSDPNPTPTATPVPDVSCDTSCSKNGFIRILRGQEKI